MLNFSDGKEWDSQKSLFYSPSFSFILYIYWLESSPSPFPCTILLHTSSPLYLVDDFFVVGPLTITFLALEFDFSLKGSNANVISSVGLCGHYNLMVKVLCSHLYSFLVVLELASFEC